MKFRIFVERSEYKDGSYETRYYPQMKRWIGFENLIEYGAMGLPETVSFSDLEPALEYIKIYRKNVEKPVKYSTVIEVE